MELEAEVERVGARSLQLTGQMVLCRLESGGGLKDGYKGVLDRLVVGNYGEKEDFACWRRLNWQNRQLSQP